MTETPDLFLSYNSEDRPDAIEFATILAECGLSVWADFLAKDLHGELFQKKLEHVIGTLKAVTILIGHHGIGRWQDRELQACVAESTKRELRVIPVLSPNAPSEFTLPVFLGSFAALDLRNGTFSDQRLRTLAWSVRGLNASLTLMGGLVDRIAERRAEVKHDANLDVWGVVTLKDLLHNSSEVIAETAAEEAARAGAIYSNDLLTQVIPLVFDLRWRRGYAIALEGIFKVPPVTKRMREFKCAEASPRCDKDGGVLTARTDGENRVLILVDNVPAVSVNDLSLSEQEMIVKAINGYGRLGVPESGGLTLLERIREIGISENSVQDDMAAALYRNRQALVPLIARRRAEIPGAEWLVPDDLVPPEIFIEPLQSCRRGSLPRSSNSPPDSPSPSDRVFSAKRAIKRSASNDSPR